MERDMSSEAMTFASFVREYLGRTREAFLASFRFPLLVQLTEPDGARRRQPDTTPAFGTMCVPMAAATAGASLLRVHPVVKKAAANPFTTMITLGRAPNNDLVFPYEEISKFHAFFLSTGTGWTLVDAQSTNGTFVRGARLGPNVAQPLAFGPTGTIELVFSGIRANLYTPARFWELAHALGGIAAVA